MGRFARRRNRPEPSFGPCARRLFAAGGAVPGPGARRSRVCNFPAVAAVAAVAQLRSGGPQTPRRAGNGIPPSGPTDCADWHGMSPSCSGANSSPERISTPDGAIPGGQQLKMSFCQAARSLHLHGVTRLVLPPNLHNCKAPTTRGSASASATAAPRGTKPLSPSARPRRTNSSSRVIRRVIRARKSVKVHPPAGFQYTEKPRARRGSARCVDDESGGRRRRRRRRSLSLLDLQYRTTAIQL